VAALDADYDWIAKEKHLFGAAEYDFSALDPRKAYEEYKSAGERLQQLREKGIQRQVRGILGLCLPCWHSPTLFPGTKGGPRGGKEWGAGRWREWLRRSAGWLMGVSGKCRRSVAAYCWWHISVVPGRVSAP
jgi:hypothetical protein